MPLKTLRKKDSTKNRTKKIQCTNILKLTFAALPTIVFGVFTVIFTIQQNEAAKAMRAQDQQINDETNRRLILKEYIHDVKELLLDEQFHSKINETMLQIRALTLTALQSLDDARKRDIIFYLYENRLIRYDQAAVVDLHDANLNGLRFARSSTESCRFHYLYLAGIYGDKLSFVGCSLGGAVFDGAILTNSEFRSCSAEYSRFKDVNFTGAILDGNAFYYADFSSAILQRASIQRGIFAMVNLTDTDLYTANINDELLFGIDKLRILPNTIMNTRLPNGTFSHINRDNLFQSSETDLNCSQRTNSNWLRLWENDTIQFHVGGIQEFIGGKCVFVISYKTSLGQILSVKKYSLIIDSNQAMLNYTVYLGLNHAAPDDYVIMLAHFNREDGSADNHHSLIEKITNPSFDRPQSAIIKIPVGTRSISAWIVCEASKKTVKSCYFNYAHISIFISENA